MANRKQKVTELMESFQALRRSMAHNFAGTSKMPRITPSQWGVLMTIQHGDGSTVKDVAEKLGITSSAATQLVDGLVESGYVIREEHAEDRRKVTLTLSNKTSKQVEKMKGEGIERFLKFFDVLNDEEFDQFIVLHKKILERHANKK